MWKLIQHSSHIHNTFRCSLLKANSHLKPTYCHIAKHTIKASTKNASSKINKLTTPKIITISLALTGAGGVKIFLGQHNRVVCQAKLQNTRIVGYKIGSDENVKFDWKRFWSYLRPHIWYFIAAIAGALAVAIINIEIPQIMGSVINVIASFSENKDSNLFMSEMKVPAIKLACLYVVQSLCTFFYIVMLSNLGEKIAYQMKTDLFRSILRQDIAFFDKHRTGEIINRLTNDIQDFKSSFKQTVSGGLRAATQIIGCSVTLVLISPQMTFVTLLCIPSVIAVGTMFGALLRNTSRKAQAQVEKTTAVADEAIGNIRTVRAFAMEDQEQQMFEHEADLARELNQQLGFGIGLFQAGTNMFLNVTVLGTLYMGGYLLSTDQLTAGEVMAFLMAAQTIQKSLSQISLLFGSVVRGVAAGGRVFEYINMKPTMPVSGGKVIPIDSLRGNIEYKNVSFTYPTRPQQTVLHNFNLTIPAGKTIALVGASGNGKSTVVALLERFYDVSDGQITIDGHDIRTLDPSWLRGKVIGFISQEPILFGTSIIENIRYGRPEATDHEVQMAAILANADDFINGFPKGYHTMVGERGVTLSGGQKQRIAIARALLKNPRVLLLDEATSALDTESEKIVQSALERAKQGRTVIVIAHRLSTIQNADLIVVLSKGRIVEMGTHDELKSAKGYYWALTYEQLTIPAG